jgi:sugar phosphate isomerase/epimerase
MCRKHDIQLLYHNHFAEFSKFGNETVYEILMNNVDPEFLKIQLDTYWVMRAGENPVEVMEKYGNRVRIIHQKDFPASEIGKVNILSSYEKNLKEARGLPENTEAGRKSLSARELDEKVLKVLMADLRPSEFTEIGTGIMDIQKIIDAANTGCNPEYIVLEQDCTQMDELESIKLSMENFKKYSGIEW